MLRHGIDYVYSPKTTSMGASGVVYGLIVGLPETLVMLPKDAIGGAGRTIETTRWSIGGKPLAEAVETVLADPDTTIPELEQFLLKHADGNGDARIVRIAATKAFNVKVGWFSRAVMWKLPEHSGWRALPISGKDRALAFAAFYRDRIKTG